MAEKIVKIADSVTVGELAETLGLSVTTLIGELFKNGIAATINQRLDFDTAQIVVEELGFAAGAQAGGCYRYTIASCASVDRQSCSAPTYRSGYGTR